MGLKRQVERNSLFAKTPAATSLLTANNWTIGHRTFGSASRGVGRITALQMSIASAMPFFCRFT
jgi:hypothetical protein